MYDRLPEYLKKPVNRRNQGEIVFGNTDVLEGNGKPADGSRIMALPSTPGSAVGYTATLVIVDEWAEQEYAEELFTAYKPTIDMGGRLIGISTGNSIGSFFHEVWSQARSGENGFFPIFLPYELRPGRDDDWYERTKRTYPSEQEFYRQYPRNELEAFLAAGGCPFQKEDFDFYMDEHVRPPLSKTQVLAQYQGIAEELLKFFDFDELQIWDLPKYKPYEVSFDPATGQEGKDYHAVQVLCLDNDEQVAELRTRCDLDIATYAFWMLSRMYHNGLMLWERTGIGAAVTNSLVRLGCENLYEHEEDEAELARRAGRRKDRKPEKRWGWPATAANCYRRDSNLIEGFRDHDIIIHSQRLLDEMMAFVRQADGRYRASGRAHDDLVTCMGMAFHVALKLAHRTKAGTQPARSSTKRRAFRHVRSR